MNSFIENINYVAGLDNRYGSVIELYKNNLSLKSVQHDIELKFSYYNNDDKKIHSIVHSEPGVLVGGINDTLLSFKTLVESSITGSEFTCAVNFVINNISMVNINIVSNSDTYKTYELKMKVVTAGAVTYDVFGEVKDSLKILPSLARITASDIDAMAKVYEIQEEIVTVSENIANVTTVSDSIANVNTVGISMSNVNIVGDDITNVNTVSTHISNVNTVSGSIANVNTVATNIVGLNSIVSNMTEILLADDNAAIATTKAGEASISAESSLQSASDAASSAISASTSAGAATTKATEASSSAASALASKNAASTSETNALASKNAASTSEANALASKNSAATSATIATTKASEALASATAAAASAASAAAIADRSISLDSLNNVTAPTPANGDILSYVTATTDWRPLAILPATKGGTGVVTSTGSGSNVLSTSPTLVTPNIGTATGTSFNSITGLSSVVGTTSGTAAVGTSTTVARADHVHPVQTTITGNSGTASKLQTARTITLSGDVSGSVNFDGSENVSITTTIGANSVILGTDTTGNYVAGLTQGTGISITGTAGEGWSPTVSLEDVGTAGTYRSVTTDAQGRVTSGTNPTTVTGYGITDAYTKVEVDTSLAAKQATLVSGTSIKTINGGSILGSGNISTVDTTKLPLTGGTMTGAITAIRETKIAMAANNIDLATGNLFTKTITTATTLTISNALASGNVNSFVLELTNGGSAVITWFSGVKWAGGIAPTLTASGKDILGFYSHDGGTTWNILGVNKDVK